MTTLIPIRKALPWVMRARWRARLCTLVLVQLLAILAIGSAVHADDSAKAGVVSTLTTCDLIGTTGKEAVMLTVEYPPGGSSLPHRHDANVFVYVLEGSVIMQVEGQKRVTLKAGQTFFEGPRDVHVVSANASSTQPAKFLVFMVKDKGAPLGHPVQGKPH